MKNGMFGINMKRYCREHEARIVDAVQGGRVTEELRRIHRERIRILQHERLVHLIVTVMVVVAEIFTIQLVLLHPEFGILPPLIMLGLAILLGFYFWHYFFLENTVQRWYVLLDEMDGLLSRQTVPDD
ncbi:MAG: hypothetical protein J6E32_06055 [Lachnospiraceae bacterium]|nr:hypothetical protein [Lachnospiraceae bacterium]